MTQYIISPNRASVSSILRGVGLDTPTIRPLVPGQLLQVRGFGEFSLGTRLSGTRGTIEVVVEPGVPQAGVEATGVITVPAGSALLDGETFTLDDGENDPVVFEFDDDATVTPGNIAVLFDGMTAPQVQASVISAINGVAGDLAITAIPGATAVQVALTNDAVGEAGNVSIADTVANAGFTHSGMSGGISTASERVLACLTDSLSSPTRYILLVLDETNRPLVRITNLAGTLVAEIDPSGLDIPANSDLVLRVSWNSQTAVAGSRLASLRVNGDLVTSDWDTDPVTAWTAFKPTWLILGRAVGDLTDFDGTIRLCQVSDVADP